jgi:hypothetical protein
MERVTRIGGVDFKAKKPKALTEWIPRPARGDRKTLE